LMFECETLLPERGPLPQKSHVRAMRRNLREAFLFCKAQTPGVGWLKIL
jgi:hypothetical protein